MGLETQEGIGFRVWGIRTDFHRRCSADFRLRMVPSQTFVAAKATRPKLKTTSANPEHLNSDPKLQTPSRTPLLPESSTPHPTPLAPHPAQPLDHRDVFTLQMTRGTPNPPRPETEIHLVKDLKDILTLV